MSASMASANFREENENGNSRSEKKRKHVDATGNGAQSRQEKSERRAKKNKSAKTSSATAQASVVDGPDAELAVVTDGVPAKTKGIVPRLHQMSKNSERENTKVDGPTSPRISKPRFILFVGNLPYTATTAQIDAHFAKLAPTSLRHRTDKVTGRSKGFAFLEFEGYEKMKTCLKLYHHSIFAVPEAQGENDGHGKGTGRKINVELTVGGGGGKSKKRKEKLRGKNVRLEEQRERTRTKEMGEKDREGKKKAKTPGTGANGIVSNVTAAQPFVERAKERDMGDVHPSRRRRIV